MGTLCMRDFIGLRTRVASTENLKVCFDLLVNTFCFTVKLGLVCGGKRKVVIDKGLRATSQGWDQLRTTLQSTVSNQE